MWNALGAHRRRSWIARHKENGLPAAQEESRRDRNEVEGGDTAAAPEFNAARIDRERGNSLTHFVPERKVPKYPDTAGLLKSAPPPRHRPQASSREARATAVNVSMLILMPP